MLLSGISALPATLFHVFRSSSPVTRQGLVTTTLHRFTSSQDCPIRDTFGPLVIENSGLGSFVAADKPPSRRGGPIITLPRTIVERHVRRVFDSVYDALAEAIRNLPLLPGAPISEPPSPTGSKSAALPSVKLLLDWSTWAL